MKRNCDFIFDQTPSIAAHFIKNLKWTPRWAWWRFLSSGLLTTRLLPMYGFIWHRTVGCCELLQQPNELRCVCARPPMARHMWSHEVVSLFFSRHRPSPRPAAASPLIGRGDAPWGQWTANYMNSWQAREQKASFFREIYLEMFPLSQRTSLSGKFMLWKTTLVQ